MGTRRRRVKTFYKTTKCPPSLVTLKGKRKLVSGKKEGKACRALMWAG